MATVIERDQPVERSERYVEVDRGDTGSWVLAIVLIALIALGLLWWFRYHTPAAANPAGSANINVTVPTPSTNGGAGASGAGGAGAGAGNGGGAPTNSGGAGSGATNGGAAR